eukprot:TRINITY_DN24950_c0_g1_i1.p1 TRINITY_DN24950_c0_g1~~TRINITY_DN24950_c0_g1_i1.p1  ORF type:complete len:435 (+),score=45.20 TRINITY_DN24950_c0_g1_i1:72-1376(+)
MSRVASNNVCRASVMAARFRERHSGVIKEQFKGGHLFRAMVNDVLHTEYPTEVIRECFRLMSTVGSASHTLQVLEMLRARNQKLDDQTRFQALRSALPSKTRITLEESLPFCRVWEYSKKHKLLPLNPFFFVADLHTKLGRIDLALNLFDSLNRPRNMFSLIMRETQNLEFAWSLLAEMEQRKHQIEIEHLHALLTPRKLLNTSVGESGASGFLDVELRSVQDTNRSNVNKVLLKMYELSMRPNQYTFRSVINSANRVYDLELMKWAVHNFSSLFMLDLESYSQLLNMCVRMTYRPGDKVEQQAEEWYNRALTDGLSHPRLGNYLFHMYGSSGNLERGSLFRSQFVKDASIKLFKPIDVRTNFHLLAASAEMADRPFPSIAFPWNRTTCDEDEDFKVLMNTQLTSTNLILESENMSDVNQTLRVTPFQTRRGKR